MYMYLEYFLIFWKVEIEMVRDIKENLCCVCLYKEMDSSKFSIDSLEKFYILFDGSKFMFNNERFFCFEVLLKFFLLGKFYSMVVILYGV